MQLQKIRKSEGFPVLLQEPDKNFKPKVITLYWYRSSEQGLSRSSSESTEETVLSGKESPLSQTSKRIAKQKYRVSQQELRKLVHRMQTNKCKGRTGKVNQLKDEIRSRCGSLRSCARRLSISWGEM